MYELKNGSERLVNALVSCDDKAIAILSNVLHYVPDQLREDIQALNDYFRLLDNDNKDDLDYEFQEAEEDENNNIDSDSGYSITISLSNSEYTLLDDLICTHDVRLSHILKFFINDLIDGPHASDSYDRYYISRWFDAVLPDLTLESRIESILFD